jgi:hypothetical protein
MFISWRNVLSSLSYLSMTTGSKIKNHVQTQGPKIFSWYMHIEIENAILSIKFTIHHDPSTVVRSQWVAVPHKSQEQACWDHRQRWHTFPQDMAHIHPSFSCPAYYQLLPRHTSTVLHNLHDTNNIMNVQCKHMDIEIIHEDQSLA